MKWNRRGILICAIGFLALMGVLAGRVYFSQSPEKNESVTYASEEDVITPSSVSGADVMAAGENDADKPDDLQRRGEGERQTKTQAPRGTATSSAVPAAAPTTTPSSEKQTEKTGKKEAKTTKGKNTKTKKNTEKPTAQPAAKPAVTAVPTASPEAATVSFDIQCTSIIDHRELWRDGLEEVIPASGYFYRGQQEISEGDTVYDVLKRVCTKNNIALDTEFTPLFGSYYIKGIGNLYEFDCGSESGWKYMVNDKYADVSCSSYTLKRGDHVVFTYDYQL